jgi:hypothetical protein
MNDILMGAIAMASMVTALFFLRFWRSTRDRFFLFFALSFFLEGCNRILMATINLPDEDAPGFYLIRLVAYAFILIAILDKNRPCDKEK